MLAAAGQPAAVQALQGGTQLPLQEPPLKAVLPPPGQPLTKGQRKWRRKQEMRQRQQEEQQEQEDGQEQQEHQQGQPQQAPVQDPRLACLLPVAPLQDRVLQSQQARPLPELPRLACPLPRQVPLQEPVLQSQQLLSKGSASGETGRSGGGRSCSGRQRRRKSRQTYVPRAAFSSCPAARAWPMHVPPCGVTALSHKLHPPTYAHMRPRARGLSTAPACCTPAHATG